MGIVFQQMNPSERHSNHIQTIAGTVKIHPKPDHFSILHYHSNSKQILLSFLRQSFLKWFCASALDSVCSVKMQGQFIAFLITQQWLLISHSEYRLSPEQRPTRYNTICPPPSTLTSFPTPLLCTSDFSNT